MTRTPEPADAPIDAFAVLDDGTVLVQSAELDTVTFRVVADATGTL